MNEKSGADRALNAARLANGVKNIIRGAAAGGPAGAAAEAVRSFLPEIIRAGAIILILILLIPLLVFVGIPHIVFGYFDTAYEDIINLTDRASYIDDVYRHLDSYSQEYIDAVIAQAAGEEGGFDEITIDSDVSQTDLSWLIAINAVAYKQDLYEMSEDSIKSMFQQMLDVSIFADMREELRLNDDGEETTVTIRTVTVTVKDLNAEEVMAKLKFTDEEKDWARVLYQSLTSGNAGRGSYRVPGEALSDERFAAMIAEGEKYLGYPYVWGGSTPETSFDCSGFVCWVINHSGIGSVGRTTAQGLYNYCTPVSEAEAKPGDLIFFTKTYATTDTCTHVAIYVGDGMMLHAGNPIQYASFETTYWTNHFYSFGRIPA
jgi:cell wall-associated NlpC family hydrolase